VRCPVSKREFFGPKTVDYLEAAATEAPPEALLEDVLLLEEDVSLEDAEGDGVEEEEDDEEDAAPLEVSGFFVEL